MAERWSQSTRRWQSCRWDGGSGGRSRCSWRRRIGSVAGASVLSEAERTVGRGRVRPLDRRSLPAVLRGSQKNRAGHRFRRACSFGCCWSVTSRGISRQRGIAWRCGDSLSLRQFLNYPARSDARPFDLVDHAPAFAAGNVRRGVSIRLNDCRARSGSSPARRSASIARRWRRTRR